MKRYIIGLETAGQLYKMALIRFITDTQQPKRQLEEMFRESLSQIFSIMDVDMLAFTKRLMNLPQMATLSYTEEPIPGDIARNLKEEFRSFAMTVYAIVMEKIPRDPLNFYVLESSSTTVAIVVVHRNDFPESLEP